MRRSAVRVLYATVVVAACGDATSPGTRPPVETLDVSVSVSPATIVPGNGALVTILAQLSDTLTLNEFSLTLSGLGTDTTVDLPVYAAGSLGYQVTWRSPTAPLRVRCGSSRAPACERCETPLRLF